MRSQLLRTRISAIPPHRLAKLFGAAQGCGAAMASSARVTVGVGRLARPAAMAWLSVATNTSEKKGKQPGDTRFHFSAPAADDVKHRICF